MVMARSMPTASRANADQRPGGSSTTGTESTRIAITPPADATDASPDHCSSPTSTSSP